MGEYLVEKLESFGNKLDGLEKSPGLSTFFLDFSCLFSTVFSQGVFWN